MKKTVLIIKIIVTAFLTGAIIYFTARLVMQDNGLWVIPWVLFVMVLMTIILGMWVPSKNLERGNSYSPPNHIQSRKKKRCKSWSIGLLDGFAYLLSSFLNPSKAKKFYTQSKWSCDNGGKRKR